MIGKSSPLQQLHLRPHSLVFPVKSLTEALKGHRVDLISLTRPGPDQKDRTPAPGPMREAVGRDSTYRGRKWVETLEQVLERFFHPAFLGK